MAIILDKTNCFSYRLRTTTMYMSDFSKIIRIVYLDPVEAIASTKR